MQSDFEGITFDVATVKTKLKCLLDFMELIAEQDDEGECTSSSQTVEGGEVKEQEENTWLFVKSVTSLWHVQRQN